VLALSAAVTVACALLLLFFAEVPLPVAVLGVLAIAVTPAFVSIHISVLSEPLFIACLMLTLLEMVRMNPASAGLAAAGAVMTRYAGVSAGAAVAIWFFSTTNGSPVKRFKRAALASAPSVISFLVWIAHNARVKTLQSSLGISYHSGLLLALRDGAATAIAWIAPSLTGTFSLLVAAILVVLLSVATIAALRRVKTPPAESPARARRLVAATGALLACYLAVIVFSRVFVGGGILFDARILSPAFLLLEMIFIVLVQRALDSASRTARSAAVAIAVAWICASIIENAPLVTDAVQDGNDFAASDWRDSPTITWVRSIAANQPVYTNWPPAIYFGAGRSAYDLPTTPNPDTVRIFAENLAARNGVLVAFDSPNPDYPPTDSLAAAAHLIRLKRFSDGTIWVPSSHPSNP